MGRLSLPTELPETLLSRPPAVPEIRLDPAILANRLALMACVPLTGAGALILTLWLVPTPALEPDLLRLLHGMVLIKGLIASAAAALVYWRLGRPIARQLATGYIGALCLCAAALGWLWGLHLMLIGALFFYGGLAGLYLVGRHDRLLSGAASTGANTTLNRR
ncbi:MAG: hypothetical protein JZU52_03595 [Lamprocystis purpurea]|jgi:hypothetical protein|uniref:hypothetical protein n=1 Tax=Lamprocystis purpurea TaxID=61598 RepID=UPI000372C877|nr:hypothetical protein [Lamprocystis purpurea]MBV5272749.1 hypothetical protein [Lamprocystis purpurea]